VAGPDLQELNQRIEALAEKWKRCGGSFDVDRKQGQLDALEAELSDPAVWGDPDRTKVLQQKRSG
jgi:hypothetical protein